MAATSAAWKRLRTYALSFPGAYEAFPWGESAVKVATKVFLFLGDGAPDSKIGIKLRESRAAASTMPGVAPMRYGLGKSGWVTVALRGGPLAAIVSDWIAESYGLVAPKGRIAELDA